MRIMRIMRITITAGAKDKILQYRINDPYIKFLIFQNEKLIPWDQMQVQISKDVSRSDELINEYISNSLIGPLFRKIDSDSDVPQETYYLKDIDLEQEFRNNPNDPQVNKLTGYTSLIQRELSRVFWKILMRRRR